VVIGGYFTKIGVVPRVFVARLNSDGFLDNSFQPNITLVHGSVSAVQTEVDGKVYVAGYFSVVDAMSRSDFARLNSDGSLDTNFVASVVSGASDLGLYGIALQADGQVLAGGNFTRFNGVNVNYLARLIADDGGAVEFAGANYSVDEGGGSATVAVRRLGSTNGTVAVNYLTIDGTAMAGVDYVAQAGALLFGPGETNKVFTVPILLDGLMETNETVTLALGNPIGGVILGTNHTATLTIINNTNAPVNTAPVLPMPANQAVDELATLTITNTATDTDLPANTLSYQLVGGPTNASISASGIISWMPNEAQGPGTNTITTVVTDNGSPPMSATNRFNVIVQEVNSAPVLSPISDQIAFAGFQLTVTNSATDLDFPANILTFSLEPGAPALAAIDPSTGLFTWRPATDQVPGTNTVTIRVTDDGVPSAIDTQSFKIVVAPPPVIESIVPTNGDVRLDWSAIVGRSYRLQFKSDLIETNWNNLSGDVTATDSTATKTDTSVSGTQRYYRVNLLY
jgi:hypothetical protein